MMRGGELSRWLFEIGARFGGHFRAIFIFSLAINILLLVSPLYMLQIYDRVLSSGSIDSLLWLTLIAIFLLGIYAAAEIGRRRVASLAGQAIEAHFVPRLFARFENGDDTNPQLLNDAQLLARVSGTFQNGAVLAYFDLPFAPLFIVVLFLLSPWLGLLGLIGAAIVFVVAVRAEAKTRVSAQLASGSNAVATELASGLVRQRSAMVAMGIVPNAYARWSALREQAASYALATSSGEGAYSGVSKSARQILQILVLAAGAALVLSQAISPGAIVASSILVARGLAPIDQITGSWRQLVQARAAWSELNARLSDIEVNRAFTPLPRPASTLRLTRLSVSVPGRDELLIRPFSLDIPATRKVVLVGGNGEGKTALLQTLAGVWAPGGGAVALGERDLHAWPSSDRGPYIGYVPQDIELMRGTVAENIARLQPDALPGVMEAARQSGAHETILTLPQGYDTEIGPGAARLSAGQTQMIGFARAVFGGPALLLLDEPTANLDADSAARVIEALRSIAAGGSIVIAATHDSRLIRAFDMAVAIRRGDVSAMPASDYAAAASRFSVVSA